MSTYISLAVGVKHVILLPPTPEASALAELLGGEEYGEADGRQVSTRRRPFPMRPEPAVLQRVLALGGYWFSMAGGGIEDATCVFLPAGWWHWILSDSDWHAAWSGSFFPDADREARGGTLG